MKCSDCAYYYKTEEDNFPCCQYGGPWAAPCEEDDYVEEEDLND